MVRSDNNTIQKFENRQILAKKVVSSICNDLKEVLQHNKTANILLSGGTSPAPIYKLLSEECKIEGKLKIGLVDERFVPTDNPKSNELLLRKTLGKLIDRKNVFKGMVFNPNNARENLILLKEEYKDFIAQTDLLLLGMGKDGHTASIFPSDSKSNRIRKNSIIDIFNTKAPKPPIKRITCSPGMILNARYIYLILYGTTKLELLENARFSLPIHDITQRRKDIKIFYCDDD